MLARVRSNITCYQYYGIKIFIFQKLVYNYTYLNTIYFALKLHIIIYLNFVFINKICKSNTLVLYCNIIIIVAII